MKSEYILFQSGFGLFKNRKNSNQLKWKKNLKNSYLNNPKFEKNDKICLTVKLA